MTLEKLSLDRPVGGEMEIWAEGKVRCRHQELGGPSAKHMAQITALGPILESPKVTWGRRRAGFRKRGGDGNSESKYGVNLLTC